MQSAVVNASNVGLESLEDEVGEEEGAEEVGDPGAEVSDAGGSEEVRYSG